MFCAMTRIVLAAAVLISFSCAVGFPMLLGEPSMQEDIGEMLSTKIVEPDSSDGSFVQQMQQPAESMAQQLPVAPLISSEEPVNVEQMQLEGNSMPQEVRTEPSSELQLTQQPQEVPTEPSSVLQLAQQPQQVPTDPSSVLQLAQQPQEVPTEPSSGLQLVQQPQLMETMQPSKDETTQSGQPDVAMLSDQPSVTTVQSDPSQILTAAQVQETSMQQATLCPPANDCPEKDTEMPSSPSVPSTASTEPPQSGAKHTVVMEPDDKQTDEFKLATSSP